MTGRTRYDRFYERDEAGRRSGGPARAVLATILGIVMPIGYSGKLYLVRELQRFGVDTSPFPEPCLQRLADSIISTCKFISKLRGRAWRSEITGAIEGAALLIANHISGDDPSLPLPECYLDILRDHGLARVTAGTNA